MSSVRANPRCRRIISSLCLLGAALLPGCAKPLLSPTDERSPFDRYDAVRNRHAPQQLEDEYGRLTPNLRGRLEPRN
jgi:hypothetical protein